MSVTERILRAEETDEDLQLIFAPGSSLGGPRPKASVIDQHGLLAIAKFPKEADDYSVERWEAKPLPAHAAKALARHRSLVDPALSIVCGGTYEDPYHLAVDASARERTILSAWSLAFGV